MSVRTNLGFFLISTHDNYSYDAFGTKIPQPGEQSSQRRPLIPQPHLNLTHTSLEYIHLKISLLGVGGAFLLRKDIIL